MDKEGASMDVSLDGWEVLPDHKSSFFMESSTTQGHGHGHNFLSDQEAKKLQPSSEHADEHQPATELKDIGVVLPSPPPSETEEPLVPDGEKEEEVAVEEAPYQFGGEEGVKKDRTQSDCMGFSVGKLRVNGIGALCSFGVAAATLCICLISGRLQHQQKLLQQQQQSQKIQLQIYGDDKSIQQVVQQTSRLNQAMSSVMGGASTRANISFGGYYDGF